MTLGADRFLDGKVRPRVLGVRSFERLDRVLQAVGRAVGRHLHHQTHVEVARRAALRIGHAPPGEAKPLPALAPPGDLQPHRPVRRRHRDGRAADRLADRDRHLDGEVLAVAPEEWVRPDLHDEVEVARRGAPAPDAALALHAHARAVAHPGGNLDRELLALLDRAGAAATRAGAHPLPAASAALRARRRPADGDRRLGTPQGVEEVHLDRVLEVAAARRTRRGAGGCARPEQLLDDVGEAPLLVLLLRRAPPTPPAGAAEAEALERALAAEGEAVPALGPALVLACPCRIEPGLQALQAELVVELALAGVGEDVVRDRDLLEALLGLVVPRVQVGVVLAGEPAVRLLYLVGARAPLDAENRVEIPLLRHRPRISRRTGAGPCRRRSRAARRRSPCYPTRPGGVRP